MIRDIHLRVVFIPLLGILIPMVSGVITYTRYSPFENIAAHLFFIFTSLSIWKGSQWTHIKVRHLFSKSWNPLPKILSITFLTTIYGSAVGGLLVLVWFNFSREIFNWQLVYKFIFITALAVIVFTLVYEILYLTKEREVDNKIVDQLDQERSLAELEVLRNELDPHFIFNSLNTLNHLIQTNPRQAFEFNNKLAQVYKYFLVNKNRQLVSLEEELNFVENYFFLLRIRYEEKLQLQYSLKNNNTGSLIPPCALQILLENAIKHNEYSDREPLTVRMIQNGNHLKVSNNLKPRKMRPASTGIGLKNLSSRYRLICGMDIKVESDNHQFSVSLPLINQ